MNRTVAALAIASVLVSPASGSPPPNSRTVFDLDCATKALFRSAQLITLTRAALARLAGQGVHTWGDRAVRSRGPGDSDSVYFVPLTCGATGNCIWGVFGGNPLRDLGRVNGDILRIATNEQNQQIVTAYERQSAMDGLLVSYVQRRGAYVPASQASVTTEEVVLKFGCDQGDHPCCRQPRPILGDNGRAAVVWVDSLSATDLTM